jgi:transcriptional repressor NrdR
VERDIQKKKKREISSKEIGEIVMKHLRNFDKVAYIRFASIYRDFRDVRTFEKELKKLAVK